MPDAHEFSMRADRYVRGDLDPFTTEAFEAELLESPQLQDAVELALGLQQLVKQDEKQPVADAAVPLRQKRLAATGDLRWYGWSLAASFFVAAVATVMLLQAQKTNDQLHGLVAQLNRPVGNVITVPVDIMRSAGSASPDVIIRKPAKDSVMILDIELQPAMARSSSIMLLLSGIGGDPVHNLEATPAAGGRVQVALNTGAIEGGRYWLQISSDKSDVTDRRLLELLPPDQIE